MSNSRHTQPNGRERRSPVVAALLFTAWVSTASALVTACATGGAVDASRTPSSPSSSSPSSLVDLLRDRIALTQRQKSANQTQRVRRVPARQFDAPTEDVSRGMQAIIGAPYPQTFDGAPSTPQQWRDWIGPVRPASDPAVERMRTELDVAVRSDTIAGVPVFHVTPRTLPARNRNRILMHIHGGGYVLGAGQSGLPEAMMMAAFGGFRVVSVDYRMPPDAPFPAGMDDVMAVWKALLHQHSPRHMAVFGTSAGGAMTLALALRAGNEGVARPAAIAPGTPWSDIAEVGDSYFTNEWVDNVLVTWHGWLGKAALLYANGHDLRDPQISPIHGDFRGMPPAILTTGTRDLFLSNTVRTHRKLRRAGVEADLNVYEGQSHAQYQYDPAVPETREAFNDIAQFFDRHLAR